MQTPETGERDELNGLVATARAGSRSAFDELVRRTYVDTYTLAFRLTGHEEDARDVVQEAYLRAWKGIRRFRGDAQFGTWMYRITANTAYTHIQRRTRQRTATLDDAPEPIEAAPRRPPGGRVRSGRRALGPGRRRRSPSPVAAPDRHPEGRLRAAARGDRRGARHLGRGGEGAPASRAQEAARPARSARRPARCLRREVRACGVRKSPCCCRRCSTATSRWRSPCSDTWNRACGARPSSPGTGACCAASGCCAPSCSNRRRGSSARRCMRSREASEQRALRSVLANRRVAYAGAIGGALAAAGATAAIVVAKRARRRAAALAP